MYREDQPGMTRSLLGLANPFSTSTMMAELKYQYFMRPSMYAGAAARGYRWSGLFGFRTIASGRSGATQMTGMKVGEFGAMGRLANSIINQPFAALLKKAGSAYNSINPKAARFLGAWSAGVEDFGIIGGLGKAAGNNTIINAISAVLGGKQGILGPNVSGGAMKIQHKVLRKTGTSAGGYPSYKVISSKKGFSLIGSKADLIDDVATVVSQYERNAIKSIMGGSKNMQVGIRNYLMGQGWTKGTAYKMAKQYNVARVALPGIAGAATRIGNITLVGSLMSQAAYMATSSLANVAKSVTPVADNIMSPAFGGGVLPGSYTTRLASTMRQRALSEMRGSAIGTRSLLGNEAALYAD